MPRKNSLAHQTIDPEPPKQSLDLDNEETQAAIMNPAAVTIVLADGEVVELKTELTLKDKFRTRALNAIQSFFFTVRGEYARLTGDDESVSSTVVENLTLAFAFRPKVQAQMADCLSILTSKTSSTFRDNLDAKATALAFTTLVRIFTNETARQKRATQKRDNRDGYAFATLYQHYGWTDERIYDLTSRQFELWLYLAYKAEKRQAQFVASSTGLQSRGRSLPCAMATISDSHAGSSIEARKTASSRVLVASS